MPYIRPEERLDLDTFDIHGDSARNPGEFNYIISTVTKNYLGEHPNYRLFNDAIGVLECAKLELYRRMIAPYEDEKCLENGDVYGTD